MSDSQKTSNEPTPSPDTTSPPSEHLTGFDGLIAGINRGQAFLVGIGALFVAAVNVEISLEQQWELAIATAGVGLIAVAVYIVADCRSRLKQSRFARRIRIAAVSVLVAVVPLSLSVLFALTMLPRMGEDGPIMAIARFDGPAFPPPYESCRPSSMLADTLSDVGSRFHHLKAFELPYILDPRGRWAQSRAWMNGTLQAADVVIFGEYSLVDHAFGSKNPDRLLINTSVYSVPLLSLGWKTAPLSEWQFPTRVVRIDQLCTRNSQRFLNDGRRLGLAVAGIALFGDQEYLAAKAALDEAEDVRIGDTGVPLTNADDAALKSDPEQSSSRCDRAPTPTAECSGVLAFYLAVLDQRLGNSRRAEREYRYAAMKLNRSAPFINLGEMYTREAENVKASRAFQSAVWANPRSVAALARLSQSEYENGNTGQAAVDLQLARKLKRVTDYDTIVLSRVLFQRNDPQSKRQAIAMMDRELHPNLLAVLLGKKLPPGLRLDSEVDYGRWNAARAKDERDKNVAIDELHTAIAAFEDVIKQTPTHIKANYQLALALASERGLRAELTKSDNAHYHDRIQQCYLTAMSAQAFTDDELTDKGNAASDLGEIGKAKKLYFEALEINPRAVYALSGLGDLYRRTHNYALALKQYMVAMNFHPRDRMLQEQVQVLSQLARPRPQRAQLGRTAKTVAKINGR